MNRVREDTLASGRVTPEMSNYAPLVTPPCQNTTFQFGTCAGGRPRLLRRQSSMSSVSSIEEDVEEDMNFAALEWSESQENLLKMALDEVGNALRKSEVH